MRCRKGVKKVVSKFGEGSKKPFLGGLIMRLLCDPLLPFFVYARTPLGDPSARGWGRTLA